MKIDSPESIANMVEAMKVAQSSMEPEGDPKRSVVQFVFDFAEHFLTR